jgi:hypothetical protein
MAKKTRTELSTLAINTNLPDNTTELITPTTERAQLTDERESVVNYKDDLGGVPNAGKFITVATDGESLTMVDEPSGVPDWVTFVTALSNLMKLKSGTNNVQLQFYDSDGTTVGGQITWNESNSKLLIVNSQTNEQISMSGGAMRLTVGTSNILIDSDGVKPSLLWSSIVRGYEGGSIALSTQPTGGGLTTRLEISSVGDATFSNSVTANTGSKITSSSADTTFSIETTSGTTIFPILDFLSSHSTVGAKIRVNSSDVISISKGGDATFSGVVNIPVGAEATPSLIFAGDSDSGMWHPAANTLAFSTFGSERLRISSGGDATFSSSIITDNEVYLDNGKYLRFKRSSGGLSIQTLGIESGTDDVRLLTTGAFKIKDGGLNDMFTISSGGTTTASRSDAGTLIQASSSSGAGSGIINFFSSLPSSADNTNCSHFQGTTQGINSWRLYGNGSSSWTSDSRLKRDIETTRDGYIDDVKKLRVVKYKWKNDPNSSLELGLIAQEVETIFPSLVVEDKNSVGDEILYNKEDEIPNGKKVGDVKIEGTTYKSVKYSVLPMILLKAIQEQQTIIEDLKSRIEALEV